jgi:hypothetical protein
MESKVNGGKPKDLASYRVDVSARTAGTVTPNKGGYKIADTSTTARAGDIYRAETGTAALIGVELMIIEANANDFTIASKIAPTASDTFYILRPITPRYDSTGASQATIDTTGLATSAKQDTQITSLQLLDDAVSTTGFAVPAKGFQATGTDGTNARALKTDSNGELQIDVLSSALPSGASTLAEQQTQSTSLAAIKTAVEILDDWDELDRAKVNPIVGQAGVQGGSGNVSASTQRVVLATDVALPAGTNNIGDVDVLSLPSIPAGTNNIGDVDVLSLPSIPAGSNNIGDVDVLTLPAIPAGTNTIGYVLAAPPSDSTNATTRSSSIALEASRVIKASSGRLQCITVTTNKASDQYLQIFNSTTVPADGTAPIYVYKLPADSTIVIDVSPIGVYFSTGISVSNSTTLATKTIGSADCYFTVEYV